MALKRGARGRRPSIDFLLLQAVATPLPSLVQPPSAKEKEEEACTSPWPPSLVPTQGRKERLQGLRSSSTIPPSSSSFQAHSRVERKRGDQPSKAISARELAPR